MKEKNKLQVVLMFTGVLLILAALSLTIFNIKRDVNAGEESVRISSILLEQENRKQVRSEEPVIYPDREMPTMEIENKRYVGTLEIPHWNLLLPVMEEWSEANARIAPCCYQGSVYQDNMIIAGHNYQSHFGKLKHIPLGAELKFTDVSGNQFYFYVSSIETVLDTDYEEVVSGEWDLTLFTCTYSGRKRDVVRCVKKNSL